MGFFTPIQLLLPQQLEDIDAAGKVGALGWVTGAGAAIAVLVTPLAGALSDRTTSRWGRRLPWLVGGTLLAAGALALLPGSPPWPGCWSAGAWPRAASTPRTPG